MAKRALIIIPNNNYNNNIKESKSVSVIREGGIGGIKEEISAN